MSCRWNQRLTYAFVGLLSGDAALVLYMVVNAFWVRATYRAAHVGEPERVVSVALQVVTLYVVCSLFGFLAVGVPVALLLPARFVARWPWLVTIAVGALLGPPALFVILLVLGGIARHCHNTLTGWAELADAVCRSRRTRGPFDSVETRLARLCFPRFPG
jgi:hypothetical protein